MDSKQVNFVQDSRLIFGKKFSNQRGEKIQQERKREKKGKHGKKFRYRWIPLKYRTGNTSCANDSRRAVRLMPA